MSNVKSHYGIVFKTPKGLNSKDYVLGAIDWSDSLRVLKIFRDVKESNAKNKAYIVVDGKEMNLDEFLEWLDE